MGILADTLKKKRKTTDSSSGILKNTLIKKGFTKDTSNDYYRPEEILKENSAKRTISFPWDKKEVKRDISLPWDEKQQSYDTNIRPTLETPEISGVIERPQTPELKVSQPVETPEVGVREDPVNLYRNIQNNLKVRQPVEDKSFIKSKEPISLERMSESWQENVARPGRPDDFELPSATEMAWEDIKSKWDKLPVKYLFETPFERTIKQMNPQEVEDIFKQKPVSGVKRFMSPKSLITGKASEFEKAIPETIKKVSQGILKYFGGLAIEFGLDIYDNISKLAGGKGKDELNLGIFGKYKPYGEEVKIQFKENKAIAKKMGIESKGASDTLALGKQIFVDNILRAVATSGFYGSMGVNLGKVTNFKMGKPYYQFTTPNRNVKEYVLKPIKSKTKTGVDVPGGTYRAKLKGPSLKELLFGKPKKAEIFVPDNNGNIGLLKMKNNGKDTTFTLYSPRNIKPSVNINIPKGPTRIGTGNGLSVGNAIGSGQAIQSLTVSPTQTGIIGQATKTPAGSNVVPEISERVQARQAIEESPQIAPVITERMKEGELPGVRYGEDRFTPSQKPQEADTEVLYYRGVGDGTSTKKGAAALGEGIYITKDKGAGKSFAKIYGGDKILEYKIKPGTKLLADNSPEFRKIMKELGFAYGEFPEAGSIEAKSIALDVKDLGYDGVESPVPHIGTVIFDKNNLIEVKSTEVLDKKMTTDTSDGLEAIKNIGEAQFRLSRNNIIREAERLSDGDRMKGIKLEKELIKQAIVDKAEGMNELYNSLQPKYKIGDIVEVESKGLLRKTKVKITGAEFNVSQSIDQKLKTGFPSSFRFDNLLAKDVKTEEKVIIYSHYKINGEILSNTIKIQPEDLLAEFINRQKNIKISEPIIEIKPEVKKDISLLEQAKNAKSFDEFVKAQTDDLIGNCKSDACVKDIFGSVSEFARQVEIKGDEFIYGNINIKYNSKTDIHSFYKINKSQLKQIYDKAHKPEIKKDTLLEQAKKAKNFEEFLDGQPTYYHGTSQDFEIFDKTKLGDYTGADDAKLGFHFMTNKEIADLFGIPEKTKEVSLDIKKPFKIWDIIGKGEQSKEYKELFEIIFNEKVDLDSEKWEDFTGTMNDALAWNNKEFKQELLREGVIDRLREKGYDGLILPITDSDIKMAHKAGIKDIAGEEIIVFEASQIKTKSQLKEIYDKAHKETKPETKPTSIQEQAKKDKILSLYMKEKGIKNISIEPIDKKLSSGKQMYAEIYTMEDGEIIEGRENTDKTVLEEYIKNIGDEKLTEKEAKRLNVSYGTKWNDMLDAKSKQIEKKKIDKDKKLYYKEQYIRRNFSKSSEELSQIKEDINKGLSFKKGKFQKAIDKFERAKYEYNKYYKKEPTIYYNGGKIFDKNKITDKGFSLTTSKKTALHFDYNKEGILNKFTVDKDANILEWKNIPNKLKKIEDLDKLENLIIKYAKDNGYDGVNLYDEFDNTGLHGGVEKEMRIFNPDIINIYNKAHKPEIKKDTLVEQAKKAKSFDEFLENGQIKVYRGLEEGDPRTNIEIGNYVTTDKKLAEYYAGKGGRIIEKVFPMKDLSMGEIDTELSYTPTKSSKEKRKQYFISNPTLKQSQLKEIYDKAHKPEVKKYKGFDIEQNWASVLLEDYKGGEVLEHLKGHMVDKSLTFKDAPTKAEYMSKVKGIEGTVVNMSPKRYIEEVAKGRNHTYEEAKSRISKEHSKKVKKIIQTRKIEAPSLEYRDNRFNQEGLHRSLALMDLGVKEMPVIVVYDSGKLPSQFKPKTKKAVKKSRTIQALEARGKRLEKEGWIKYEKPDTKKLPDLPKVEKGTSRNRIAVGLDPGFDLFWEEDLKPLHPKNKYINPNKDSKIVKKVFDMMDYIRKARKPTLRVSKTVSPDVKADMVKAYHAPIYELQKYRTTQLENFGKTIGQFEQWFYKNYTEKDLVNIMLAKGDNQTREGHTLKEEALKKIPKEMKDGSIYNEIQKKSDEIYNEANEIYQRLGNKERLTYVQKYFYGNFKRNKEFRDFFGKDNWKLNQKFFKGKNFLAYGDAYAQGLRLKDHNPVSNLLSEYGSILKIKSALDWVDDAMEKGEGLYIEKDNKKKKVPEGWKRFKEPLLENYVAQETMVDLRNNYTSVDIANRSNWAKVFLKDIPNANRVMSFIGSLWHIETITIQSMADTPGLAVTRKSFWEAFRSLGTSAKQISKNIDKNNPYFKNDFTKRLLKNGITDMSSAQRESFAMMEKTFDKVARGNMLGGALNIGPEVIKVLPKFMFDYWIPQIKIAKATYYNDIITKKIGRELTDAELQDVIIDQQQNFYGMMNEKGLYGRSSTVLRLLRFMHTAPFFAEGDANTIALGFKQSLQSLYNFLGYVGAKTKILPKFEPKGNVLKGPKGNYYDTRSVQNMVKVVILSIMKGVLLTLLLTGKGPEGKKEKENYADFLLRLMEIRTGMKDSFGNEIVLKGSPVAKDYVSITHPVMTGNPVELAGVLKKRTEGMQIGTFRIAVDMLYEAAGKDITDYKGDKITELSDDVVRKYLKIGIYELEKLSPYVLGNYNAARKKGFTVKQSLLIIAGSLYPTNTNLVQKEKKLRWQLNEKMEKQRKFYSKLYLEDDPYKAIEKWNKDILNIFDSDYSTERLEDEYEDKLIINSDKYLSSKLWELTNPSLEDDKKDWVLKTLDAFGLSGEEMMRYLNMYSEVYHRDKNIKLKTMLERKKRLQQRIR